MTTERKWSKLNVKPYLARVMKTIALDENVYVYQLVDTMFREKHPAYFETEGEKYHERQETKKKECDGLKKKEGDELSLQDCYNLTKDCRDLIEGSTLCDMIDYNRVTRGGSRGVDITAFDIANYLGLGNFLPK